MTGEPSAAALREPATDDPALPAPAAGNRPRGRARAPARRRMRRAAAVLAVVATGTALGAALGAAGVARAQDVVAVPGELPDEDFYRLVSCAAPPGGACAAPVLRWAAERPIRVSLRRVDPGFVGRRRIRAEAALTRALRALNDSGAGFRLARVAADQPAEIGIYFLDLAEGAPIAGTGIAWVDGAEAARITTRVAVDAARGRIRAAAIVATPALATAAYEPALLAQLTRAMGLMTAVDSPAYRGVSVLADAAPDATGGATRLAPQDITALRRHYGAAPH